MLSALWFCIVSAFFFSGSSSSWRSFGDFWIVVQRSFASFECLFQQPLAIFASDSTGLWLTFCASSSIAFFVSDSGSASTSGYDFWFHERFVICILVRDLRSSSVSILFSVHMDFASSQPHVSDSRLASELRFVRDFASFLTVSVTHSDSWFGLGFTLFDSGFSSSKFIFFNLVSASFRFGFVVTVGSGSRFQVLISSWFTDFYFPASRFCIVFASRFRISVLVLLCISQNSYSLLVMRNLHPLNLQLLASIDWIWLRLLQFSGFDCFRFWSRLLFSGLFSLRHPW